MRASLRDSRSAWALFQRCTPAERWKTRNCERFPRARVYIVADGAWGFWRGAAIRFPRYSLFLWLILRGELLVLQKITRNLKKSFANLLQIRLGCVILIAGQEIGAPLHSPACANSAGGIPPPLPLTLCQHSLRPPPLPNPRPARGTRRHGQWQAAVCWSMPSAG